MVLPKDVESQINSINEKSSKDNKNQISLTNNKEIKNEISLTNNKDIKNEISLTKNKDIKNEIGLTNKKLPRCRNGRRDPIDLVCKKKENFLPKPKKNKTKKK